jgi:hypothetical protein
MLGDPGMPSVFVISKAWTALSLLVLSSGANVTPEARVTEGREMAMVGPIVLLKNV